MSAAVHETRRNYAAQRGVSQGAAITLVAISNGFQARFNCATRCAEILGHRNFDDYGSLPLFFIPMSDVYRSLIKLSETLSIALVDTVTDDQGTRFALVWKIPARAKEINLDDY